MSTKSKIIFSVGILCIVVSIAVVAIVAVWAASSQTVTSAISVKYYSNQVVGTAKANVIVGGKSTAMTTTGQSSGSDTIKFTGDEASDSNQTLKPVMTGSYIELTTENNYVVFEYIFTNSADHAYTASLTYSGDDSNFTKKYAIRTSALTTGYATSITTNFTNTLSTSVTKTNTTYVYIMLTISSNLSDASFVGNFVWGLNGVPNSD